MPPARPHTARPAERSAAGRTRPALALLCWLAACAEIPDLGEAVPAAALEGPYPRLVNVDALLQAPPPRTDAQTAPQLSARAGSLQARAAALRGAPVIDPAARRRLAQRPG